MAPFPTGFAEATASESMRTTVRDPRTWALGSALVVMIVVQVTTIDDGAGPFDRLVFTVVPTCCLWLVASQHVLRRRSIAATSLFVAVSPTVFTSVAAGERHGAFAVVAACLASMLPRRRSRLDGWLATGIAAFAVAGLAIWWGSGVSRGGAPGPSWRDIAGRTGDVVARGFAVVGPDEVSLPSSGWLAWWCCVGIVMGAALLGSRPLPASAVPLAVVAYVVASWSIQLWRGPVDPAGGTFLIAGAVAFVGSSSTMSGEQAVRFARLVAIAGPAVWVVSLVRLYRADGSPPVVYVLVAAGVASIAAALWPSPGDELASPTSVH